jgi:hypothetical protein
MQMHAPVVSFLLIFLFFDLFIFAYCCSLAIVHGASISVWPSISIHKQTTNVCEYNTHTSLTICHLADREKEWNLSIKEILLLLLLGN